MSAPLFQQVETLSTQPDRAAAPRRNVGCVAVLLLLVFLPVLAALGAAAGFAVYLLAWGVGTPSIGVSIVAGLTALAVVCVATSLGMGLGVVLLPEREHPLLRTAGVLAASVLGPWLLLDQVLMLAVPAGIGAGLMFHWCQPLIASILLGALAPLFGVVLGVVLFGHTMGDSNGGNGSDWASDWGYGDGDDGGGE